MNLAGWALVILLAGAVAAALYWLLVITEGAYLGPRVVTLLYDRYAGRYDTVKEYDAHYEAHFIGEPVARFLEERGLLASHAEVLDAACGTGRFAQAVLRETSGAGRFVCLDRSQRMLEIARQNLHKTPAEEVAFVQHDVEDLPFEDNRFAVVACLEALEFMPRPPAVLDELVRVAAPGGLIVLTNRIGWQAWLFPGKRYSRQKLSDLLRSKGCTFVSITPWQLDYDRVLAVKAGDSAAGQAGISEAFE